MKLVTSQQMQEIDRQTIEGGYVPGLTLMENAGMALAQQAMLLIEAIAEPHVEILCGKGNNGGDGLVVARLLAECGVHTRVWLTHRAGELSVEAQENFARLAGSSIVIQQIPTTLEDPGPITDRRGRPDRSAFGALLERCQSATNEPTDDFVQAMQQADLCVDALVGTGVQRQVSPQLSAVLNTANRHCRTILAVDIPSGVDGNTGEVHGTSSWADLTVTIGLPKMGLVFYPGAERVGRLHVVDIGFPETIIAQAETSWSWMGRASARRAVPYLAPTVYKYQRGTVLVIAGSREYPGAASLTAEAALRSGAGMVHLVVPASIRDILESRTREVIVHGVPETTTGSLHPQAREVIVALLEKAAAVALGPGLSADPETLEFIASLLKEFDIPHVVDADALMAVGETTTSVPRVVTPHSGELARMVGSSRLTTAMERVNAAVQLAQRQQLVVLAKGAPTVVVSPDGQRIVNGSGNPGLATAGSGDVLTGLLGGLLAQGMEASDAAALAAYLHGRAADILARDIAARSLVSGDLLLGIGKALSEITAN
jgi:hydroxyethylthiazole kinase-like uncharacterized protein yjeF